MKQEFYETRNSAYCYNGTDILINNFDLKDNVVLADIERKIVFAKL